MNTEIDVSEETFDEKLEGKEQNDEIQTDFSELNESTIKTKKNESEKAKNSSGYQIMQEGLIEKIEEALQIKDHQEEMPKPEIETETVNKSAIKYQPTFKGLIEQIEKSLQIKDHQEEPPIPEDRNQNPEEPVEAPAPKAKKQDKKSTKYQPTRKGLIEQVETHLNLNTETNPKEEPFNNKTEDKEQNDEIPIDYSESNAKEYQNTQEGLIEQIEEALQIKDNQ